jgi:fluoride exporter
MWFSGDERMETVLFIAGFGALGCLARYFLSGWVYALLGRGFPYGTFAVNIFGAFFIGLVMEFSMRSTMISQNLRIGLAIGFLGGLTTFSTFSFETFKLLEDGQFAVALANVLLSVTVCLIFTWLGIIAARQI